jgi:hypothetical protein
MPVFDMNLLLLMGISSGTYIGYKFSEKSTPDDTSGADSKQDEIAKTGNNSVVESDTNPQSET